MRTIIPVLLIVAFIFASCIEKKKTAKDQLYDKVMAVHDEIMPKLGDLMNYKRQLNEKIDSLRKEENDSNAGKISELEKAVTDLDNSHEEMMGWMHQFDTDFEGKVKQEIMDYLNDQMAKIEYVGVTTNNALKNAGQILAK